MALLCVLGAGVLGRAAPWVGSSLSVARPRGRVFCGSSGGGFLSVGVLRVCGVGVGASGGWSGSSRVFRAGGALPGAVVCGSGFLPVRLLLVGAGSGLSILSGWVAGVLSVAPGWRAGPLFGGGSCVGRLVASGVFWRCGAWRPGSWFFVPGGWWPFLFLVGGPRSAVAFGGLGGLLLGCWGLFGGSVWLAVPARAVWVGVFSARAGGLRPLRAVVAPPCSWGGWCRRCVVGGVLCSACWAVVVWLGVILCALWVVGPGRPRLVGGGGGWVACCCGVVVCGLRLGLLCSFGRVAGVFCWVPLVVFAWGPSRVGLLVALLGGVGAAGVRLAGGAVRWSRVARCRW